MDMMKENLPHSEEAERAVIGSMIIDKESVLEIIELLSPDDFYFDDLRIIFEVIADLYNSNKAIDIITITNKLGDIGLTSTVGGSSKIAKIITDLPAYKNGLQYAKIIKEKGILRKVINSSHEIQTMAQDKKLDEKKLAEKVVELEAEVAGFGQSGKPRIVNSNQLVQKLNEEIKEFEDGKVVSISTGFQNMDKIVDGFFIPHIWIIGGYTGTGKTFFTLNLMLNLIKNGARPILFSTENSATRNILRLIGCLTGYHEMKIFKGRYTEAEAEKISEAKKQLEEMPLVIYDSVFNTAEIRLKVKKHKIKDKVNLVVIDYIQNLNQGDDLYAQMSKVAMDLQKIALELGVGVIGVSQVSNQQINKQEKGVISFKGAGEITAIADVAMRLLRNTKEGESRKIRAQIDKVRHGTSGVAEFQFFSQEALEENKYIKEL